MSMRVAFIGFGEVAAVFATSLAERGVRLAAYDVLWHEVGGPEKLRCRAPAEVELCAALEHAVRGSHYILSTVTTSAACQAAKDCAAYLGPGQTYVDFNSTEPAVKQAIEQIISPSGAAFVEGALLGAVGVTGPQTQLLLGGPHARSAQAALAEVGFNARFYSDQIGKASLFKMLRSVFSKGMEALLIECLVAGQRAGIREDLWQEITSLLADEPFANTASNWVRTHATAHRRRYEEVRQVAAVLSQLGIQPMMAAATEAFFERSCRLGLQERFEATPPDMNDFVEFMNQQLGNTP
jgi:3-hydroxyisobutyrate dehydrogenase-like beta-hydroxyacid dehydrogenase